MRRATKIFLWCAAALAAIVVIGGAWVRVELDRAAHPTVERLLSRGLPGSARVLAAAGEMNYFNGCRYFTIAMSEPEFAQLCASVGFKHRDDLFSYYGNQCLSAPASLSWPAIHTNDAHAVFAERGGALLYARWESGLLYLRFDVP